MPTDDLPSLSCVSCGHTTRLPSHLKTTEPLHCEKCGADLGTAESLATFIEPSVPERQFGRFRLDRRLGRGAFGEVWMAWDPRLERSIALKIPIQNSLSTADCKSLVHEARAAARLDHDNIVRIYEVGDEDLLYLAAELVEGADLRTWSAAHRPEYRQAAEIMLGIASALAHAHERHVIHRDLKPDNVLMDRNGRPRVTDFGLARRLAAEQTISHLGFPMGTPSYMSPEQARGQGHQADGRTDLYAWGVMLFELLTGELPFRGNVRMILMQKQWNDAPSPRQLDDRIPRDLETICLKCMERDPERRPATAGELVEEVQRYLRGEPIRWRPVSQTERTWRWCQRQRLWLMPSIAVLLLIAGIIAVSLVTITASRNAERTARTEAESLAAANAQLADQQRAARDVAEQQRQEAVARLRDARDAVDLWLTGVSEQLREAQGLDGVRRTLLERAAADYERFAQQADDSFDLQLERARTLLRVGDIRRELGDIEASQSAYEGATRVANQLTGKALNSQQRIAVGIEMANAHTRVALIQWEQGHDDAARLSYDTAATLLRELREQNLAEPRIRESLASVAFNRGLLELNAGRAAEATDWIRRSIDEWENLTLAKPDTARYQLSLSSTRSVLAGVFQRQSRLPDAAQQLGRAITELDRLIERDTDRLAALKARSDALIELAICQTSAGKVAEALSAYERSMADLRNLSSQQPELTAHRESLALAMLDASSLLNEYGQARSAQALLGDCEPLCRQLHDDLPELPRIHQLFASCLLVRAQLWLDQGAAEKSETHISAAHEAFDRLSRDYPDVPTYAEQLVCCEAASLRHRLATDHPAEDAMMALKAVASRAESCLSNATDSDAGSRQRRIALLLFHLSHLCWEAAPAESARLRDGAAELLLELVDSQPTPERLHDAAWVLVSHPAPHASGQRAIELARKASEDASENLTYRATLGAAYGQVDDWNQARRVLEQCFAMNNSDSPESKMSTPLHGRARFWLAMALYKTGDVEGAKQVLKDTATWMDAELPQQSEMRHLRHRAENLITGG